MGLSAQQQATFETVEAWRRGELELAPVTRLLGIRPAEVGEGRAAVVMLGAQEHENVFGDVHGGLLCALADVAMGLAVATTLDGEGFTTLEQHIDHIRATRRTQLTASALVTHRGRKTAHVKCSVTDGAGRLLAEASSVCLIFAGAGSVVS